MNNSILKLSMAFFAGLLIISQSNAQEVWSLQDCKQKALDHNQKVKSAISDYKASEAGLKLSQRAHLPNINFESSYLYLKDPNQMKIPGYELPSTNGLPSGVWSPASTNNLTYENTYSASLGLSLPIYMGGKLQHAKHISSLALELAADHVELTKSDLLLDVEEKYWGLVSLKEQKTVLEKSVILLTDVVKQVTNWYETGIVTKNEVLKAQVELNNVKLAYLELKNNVELSKMSLNQTIGNGILSSIKIQDSILIIPGQLSAVAFDENQLNDRPEVKMLNNQLEISKTQKKLVNADYMPQLVSFANYMMQNPNHYAEQEDEFTFNAGVSLNIPVFHWGEKKVKKTTATDEYSESRI